MSLWDEDHYFSIKIRTMPQATKPEPFQARISLTAYHDQDSDRYHLPSLMFEHVANDKSPISEIATQHMALIPISTPNMLWSNFATRTFVGRIDHGMTSNPNCGCRKRHSI
jgi:hypothetical protein